MGLLQPMLRHLLRAPARTVIVDDWRTWRGIHLLGAALHVARRLESETLRPHIGFMLPTSGLTSLAVLAIWMLGRTAVPINYLLRTADRDFVIANAELDAVITVGGMLDAVGPLPAGVTAIQLEQMTFKGLPPLRRVNAPAPDALAALLYTSGTSGRPKGVMLTAGNLEANIRQCIEWAGIPRHSVLLGVLPQFHCFGLTVLTLLPLWLGSRVIYTARFQPKKILDLLAIHRPSIMLAIPSMLNALLNAKEATRDHFASVRYLVSGGEPLPQAVFEGFRNRFGVVLNEGYGLTETAPVANWCRPQDHKRGSVGPPLPGVEERIVAPDGMALRADQDGEIRVRGPNVMRGYYKLEAETRAAFDADGFFRTGDMGRIDAEGHLYITGRLKDMLVIGGENVFPRSIEEVLDAHPSVLASAVLGVPNAARGEVPVAFVELVAGAGFDEVALRAHCRRHLAAHQVPRLVHHLERLPRSPTGKILRRELRGMR